MFLDMNNLSHLTQPHPTIKHQKRERGDREEEKIIGMIYFGVSDLYQHIVKGCDSVRKVINELDATFLNLDIPKQLTQKKEYQDFRFSEESVIIQFIKYESMFSRCIELGVTILVTEKKEFFVKSLPAEL
jgi:gag-polypeptide of LTR copia-type